MPLPESVHAIDGMPPERKRHAFPGFMSNMDLPMARHGVVTRYNRKFTDMKFLCTVRVTGRGFLTYNPEIKTPKDLIGKRIAVAPPTSSMRVMSNTILRDAWGILDQVELKVHDLTSLKEALLGGEIDVAFEAQAWEGGDGRWSTTSSVMELIGEKQTYWLNISQEDADKVDQKNVWQLLRVAMPKGSLPGRNNPPEGVAIPAYVSTMVAWDTTEEEVAYELVKFLAGNAEAWSERTNMPMSLDRFLQFPGLTEDMVHPGALSFYRAHNIKIPQ
jgi:TRAP-type uncharacterized transport system substrate-binding protein